ncbi:DMT family transporter [Clostridium sp. YIM B02551]|uniref:DMT family transporter n=1 Tax=Clostridium sp. YIM B02551 TaxID=2910679 RepID=UPI001EE9B708|nr:DMT family transporter [Clostridium sp. YIM B02551]
MKINTKVYSVSLLLVAAFWGFGFVASKEALNSFPPFVLTSIRFTVSGFILLIIFIKRIKNLTLKSLGSGILLGFFLFLGFSTQTVGLVYTTASKNAFITGLNVIIVPFLAWIIFKDKLEKFSVFSAVLAFLGIFLLTWDGSSLLFNFGDTLTLFCALFFAMHITFVGVFSKKYDPILLTIIQFLVTGILALICSIKFENLSDININNSLVSLGYLTFVSTLLAFLMQNIAQKHTKPSQAALILCTESLFGPLFSSLVLKETLTIQMIFGGAILFLSIIICETKLSFLHLLFRKENSNSRI